jgi:hypothetical protein
MEGIQMAQSYGGISFSGFVSKLLISGALNILVQRTFLYFSCLRMQFFEKGSGV